MKFSDADVTIHDDLFVQRLWETVLSIPRMRHRGLVVRYSGMRIALQHDLFLLSLDDEAETLTVKGIVPIFVEVRNP